MTCEHGFIGACGECDGAGQVPAFDLAQFEAVLPKRRRTRSMPPMLRQGEVVRLVPDGPTYRVVRVNSCAAYLKRSIPGGKIVELPNGRSFTATEDAGLIAVSPFAFVYRG